MRRALMAGSAIGALVTGGEPLMGAMTAGISAGVAAALKVATPLPDIIDNAISNQYLKELALSTSCGALAGGVTAEMFGGNFGQGAAYGAAGAAAGYAVSTAIAGFLKSVSPDTPEEVIAAVEFGEPKLGDTYEQAIDITATPWRLNPETLEYNKFIQGDYPELPTINPFEYGFGKAVKKFTQNFCNRLIEYYGKDTSYCKGWVRLQKWEYKRHWFFWKRWKPVGKTYWREVTVGKGWEEIGYSSHHFAFEAAFRESYMKYEW